MAIEMLDEHEQKREALALQQAVEIASADAGDGTGDFAAALLERDILPHLPLQAGAEQEEVRIARARNRVRELQKSRGYRVSRRLRLRSEHIFAEAKTCHGMDRARVRGCRRLQVQADLAATAQNLKRLVSFQSWKRRRAAQTAQVQGVWSSSQYACGLRSSRFVRSPRRHDTAPRPLRRCCPTRQLRKRHSSTDF